MLPDRRITMDLDIEARTVVVCASSRGLYNMAAPVELIKRVIDGMVQRRFGRIVNITSASVKMPAFGSRSFEWRTCGPHRFSRWCRALRCVCQCYYQLSSGRGRSKHSACSRAGNGRRGSAAWISRRSAPRRKRPFLPSALAVLWSSVTLALSCVRLRQAILPARAC